MLKLEIPLSDSAQVRLERKVWSLLKEFYSSIGTSRLQCFGEVKQLDLRRISNVFIGVRYLRKFSIGRLLCRGDESELNKVFLEIEDETSKNERPALIVAKPQLPPIFVSRRPMFEAPQVLITPKWWVIPLDILLKSLKVCEV